jgi:predicted O-methyltransferase YrrM
MPLLIASAWQRSHGQLGESRVTDQRRSLLGALRVIELPVGRMLTHGRIRHGMQLSDPALRRTPVMYYGPGTALAQVMARHHHQRPRRIGVVGLGTGTIAAYGRAGDRLRFYELDPNVLDLARSRFSYLSDSAASIETRLGDGRLSLAGELPQGFDLFVLDAFASDAVPVHLLTREAFGTYLSHLAPDGVLLVNVANRHLALDRVVRGAAQAHQLACEVVETPADPKQYVSRVRWALLTRSAAQLRELTEGMNPAPARLGALGWSDGHASLWPLLR